MPETRADHEPAVYLIGSGIASLAAAAFLIRDGDIPGHNITILEESETIGGSLDAAGTPKDGYVMRGGRMLESKYLCTFDLFSSIPTLDERKTVTQEIFEQNEMLKTSSKSRLFRGGHRVNVPKSGLIAQRTSPSSDSSVSFRTTWCSRWNTLSGPRKPQCTRSSD
jgi:oleate hydratase